jgi:hypothetical protein
MKNVGFYVSYYLRVVHQKKSNWMFLNCIYEKYLVVKHLRTPCRPAILKQLLVSKLVKISLPITEPEDSLQFPKQLATGPVLGEINPDRKFTTCLS